MRTLIACALFATVHVPASRGAVVHVAPRDAHCTPRAGGEGSGTAADPYTNLYFALTQGRVTCGDTVELHGGTYRVSTRGTSVFADGTPADRHAHCDDEPTDTGGPSGYDSTRTVLPLFRQCSADQPLVVQNAAGEDVVLDGTPIEWDQADLWTRCESANRCGPAEHLHLTDPSRTYWTDRLAVCSKSTPAACDVQLWLDPTATSPGRRLGCWANSGWQGAIDSNEPANHDRFDEADLAGLDGALAGRFFAVRGALLIVRLARAFDPTGDPSRHAVRIAGGGYEGGVGAVISAHGARWITVRRHPRGGSLRALYGNPVVAVGGGSTDLTFEGLDLAACGGRTYGNCVRVHDGERVTLRGGSAFDAMGENIALYGGGPGCSTNNGCARQIHDCVVEQMRIGRGGRAFYDGGGVGVSLGDGIVIKNCERCRAVGNTITDQFTRGIRVNTSTQKSGCTAARRPDPTSCDWTDPDGTVRRGRCEHGRCVTDVCENTRTGCSSDGFVIDGNVIDNVGHFQRLGAAGAPYPPPVEATDDGGCIWITTRDGIHHASNGRIVNNMCSGRTRPPRQAAIPGIKVQAIDGMGPPAGSTILIANNTIAGVNGYCLDVHELSAPVRFVNNLFDRCATAPAMRLPAAVYAPTSVGHTHAHNAYSRTATAARTSSVTTVASNAIVDFESTAAVEPARFLSDTDLHLRCDAPQRGAGIALGAPVLTDVDGEPRPTGDGVMWDIGADQATCRAPAP